MDVAQLKFLRHHKTVNEFKVLKQLFRKTKKRFGVLYPKPTYIMGVLIRAVEVRYVCSNHSSEIFRLGMLISLFNSEWNKLNL